MHATCHSPQTVRTDMTSSSSGRTGPRRRHRVLASLPSINGRRGWFLLLFAAAYTTIGTSYSCRPSPQERLQALAWLLEWIRIQDVGCLWFAAAAVAAVSAFWTIPADKYGYAALFAAPAIMGVLVAISWAVGDYPGGLNTMVLYETIATAVLVVAGMTNPVAKARP